MKREIIAISTTLAVLGLAACAAQKPTSTTSGTVYAKQGFEVSGMDTSVRPQDDFYHYAVGKWLEENPIPEDQTIWSAFHMLRDQTLEHLKQVAEEAAAAPATDPGSAEYRVGTFYRVAMDEQRAEAAGLKPLEEAFARIDQISDPAGLHRELAHLMTISGRSVFVLYVAEDDRNAQMNAAHIFQGGLSLPDRDYYVEQTERNEDIRAKYLTHLQTMHQLMGDTESEAKAKADIIMALETRLAQASNTRTENRDPLALYNKMSVADAKALTVYFDWDAFLSGIGVPDPGELIINQPKFIKEVGQMVHDVPLDQWQVYLKWHLLSSMAGALDSRFVNEDFAFNERFLNGQEVIQPRWKRVLNSANFAVGEPLGQLYVARYFPPEAKERALAVVRNLLWAMGERIKGLTWMSEPTKQKALEKLSTFGVKIGYPDKWKDLSGLEVKDDTYAENLMRTNRFYFAYDAKKINRPVDKAEWGVPPQIVNAWYNPTMNDITFPAGILQYPFFDKDVDDAINYGAMGAVIGHEITHGFDDQGRHYDKDGNLNEWWTPADAAEFKKRADLLVGQYNNYALFDGYNVKGEMTLGENIADLGGITMAYLAFTRTDQFKRGEPIDGFTPKQRFFLSWAQVWRTNIRDEAAKNRLTTDVHSPAVFRVIGPLTNFTAFFDAFDVNPRDKMRNPEDKLVVIW